MTRAINPASIPRTPTYAVRPQNMGLSLVDGLPLSCTNIQLSFVPVTLILCRKLNARNIQLCHDTKGQTIGVLCRNGEYRYLPWLGFLERAEARTRGKSVKLLVDRIGQGDVDGWNVRWVDVNAGRHVQGCLTPQGVFAVVDQNVRVF